jgi:hypothetical protein
MKKIFILTLIILSIATTANAQDLKKQIATAQSSYAAGNLQETHFALQQMMQEIDLSIGKEILKLLPAKFDTLKVVQREDNVSANGMLGATTQRIYGGQTKKVEVQVMSNSPVAASLNTLLTSPYLNNDGRTKNIKVQGYKARLTKDAEVKDYYTLEIPFANALLTIKANASNETEITAFANSIPLSKLAALMQ